MFAGQRHGRKKTVKLGNGDISDKKTEAKEELMQIITKKQNQVIAAILTLAMVLSGFSFMQGTAYAADGEKKMPYKEGDDISRAAFYIAVDADDDGTLDDVYYYTEDEIKAYGETGDYRYNNHDTWMTDSVKGAKLSTLIDELGGEAKVESTDTIKYMEYDAYHSNKTQTTYQDTVAGLEDDPSGNGSGFASPAETMIAYSAKTSYENPDENNQNDKDYIDFKNYEREVSPFRGFRQTGEANSLVLKMLMGVVITGEPDNYGQGTETQGGYALEHYSPAGKKIADDYQILGLVAGMKWAAAPQALPWAKADGPVQVITAEKVKDAKHASQMVRYTYSENEFLKVSQNGKSKSMTRSDIKAADDIEIPSAEADNHKYEYFGYNKPMYVRYQGAWLKDVLDDLTAGQRVFIVDESGKNVEITKNLDDYFVAYYYSQSKSSTNIPNVKRVPLYYGQAVLVDTASAPVERSDDDSDYTAESGKEPITYKSPKAVVVMDKVSAPTSVKAVLGKYNQAKVTWKAVSKADGYTVSYKKDGASKWTSANVKNPSFTKGSLTAGAGYQFKVKAHKTVSGVKVYSSETSAVKITTLKAPVVKLSKKGKSSVKVSYADIKGESGYQIYRSVKSKTGYSRIAQLSANKTSFTDSKTKKGGKYYYKVRAYKTSGGKKIYGPWSKIHNIKR